MKKILFTVLVAILPVTMMATDINKIPVIGHFVRNWSAIDSSYIEPTLYDFAIQAVEQNNQEQMTISGDNGVKIKVRSPWEANAGVGAYWRSIGTNFTLSIKKDGLVNGTKKTQFGFHVFSQLFNINVLYRRTGGDFRLKEMYFPGYGDMANMGNIVNDAGDVFNFKDYQIGEDCAIKMFNLDVNYIWNHKKFSYPAAQSFGSRQIRSAGSLITGLAYTHYNVDNAFADYQASMAGVAEKKDGLALYEIMNNILNGNEETQLKYGKKLCTTMKFTDFSLNVGYAYNWVPMQNFLVSGAVTLSPAIKICKGDNYDSQFTSLFDKGRDPEFRELLRQTFIEQYEELDPTSSTYDASKEKIFNQLIQKVGNGDAYNQWQYAYTKTVFDLNYSARLALNWNNSRWYAGVHLTWQHYRYHSQLYSNFDNTFYTFNFTLGLRLGRKADYRKGGKYAGKYRDPAIF